MRIWTSQKGAVSIVSVLILLTSRLTSLQFLRQPNYFTVLTF